MARGKKNNHTDASVDVINNDTVNHSLEEHTEENIEMIPKPEDEGTIHNGLGGDFDEPGPTPQDHDTVNGDSPEEEEEEPAAESDPYEYTPGIPLEKYISFKYPHFDDVTLGGSLGMGEFAARSPSPAQYQYIEERIAKFGLVD